MKYANGAVLEALHLAQYRQIPWHKRPAIFTSLHSLGLIDTVLQQPPVDPKYFTPTPIAVLTEKGKSEAERLEACKRTQDWEYEQLADYLCKASSLS
ncbi:hypothetical protein AWB69_05826 [Caballeronia udeis]|uniref:Uncharacterized protein n=1 Tax=Caballeronia udeis TaxID=1232866 RepID=A0A158IF59_9BURK|nr:hypothetical protein [Caballeronia udeis]SAL54650.1 hypothetical protein AWB69_05826 [Caballeronia udeis]